jgi:hypothetical protein
MTSIGKTTFNYINSLTIHSMLNIHLEQSLCNLPNLFLNSLNRLTCQCEQLQFIVIGEISFVGVRMLKIVNSRLRCIECIKKKLYVGLDFIMTSGFLSNTTCEK